jgi:hypothetical protein
MSVHVMAKNYQGNEYRRIFEKELDHLCDLYNEEEKFKEPFEYGHDHLKVKVLWKTCPYPKGPNEMFNLEVSELNRFLPEYLPGNEKWKIEARFSLHGKVLGGYNLYATLRSERSLLNG